MTSTEMPIDTGVCETCGKGVHLDEEGRTACDGCGRATMQCSCQPAQQQEQATQQS